jgi:hypothetical protein
MPKGTHATSKNPKKGKTASILDIPYPFLYIRSLPFILVLINIITLPFSIHIYPYIILSYS